MAGVRRGRPRPPIPSPLEKLAHAIAFHRALLATPIDDHFMTPEQMRQRPLPPEPAPQSRKTEQYLITRVTCTLEVPSEERRSILAAARWPLAAVATLAQGKRTRTVLAPGVYLLSSPLTDAERQELQARQATQLREFDERRENPSNLAPSRRGWSRSTLRLVCPGQIPALHGDRDPGGSVRLASFQRVRLGSPRRSSRQPSRAAGRLGRRSDRQAALSFSGLQTDPVEAAASSEARPA